MEIPWDDLNKGATFSIELSRWCKEHGLEDAKDYHWHFMPTQRLTVFYFQPHCESYATMLALKWPGEVSEI